MKLSTSKTEKIIEFIYHAPSKTFKFQKKHSDTTIFIDIFYFFHNLLAKKISFAINQL
jgi:hypothetical protein